jgi:hypothetical protein
LQLRAFALYAWRKWQRSRHQQVCNLRPPLTLFLRKPHSHRPMKWSYRRVLPRARRRIAGSIAEAYRLADRGRLLWLGSAVAAAPLISERRTFRSPLTSAGAINSPQSAQRISTRSLAPQEWRKATMFSGSSRINRSPQSRIACRTLKRCSPASPRSYSCRGGCAW